MMHRQTEKTEKAEKGRVPSRAFSPRPKPKLGIRDRSEKQRQRETETEKERQRKRGRDSVKQSGPPSLMQTAYAHKPKSAFILLPMRSLVSALWCSVLAYAGFCL